MKKVIQLSFIYVCLSWTSVGQTSAQQIIEENPDSEWSNRKWSISFSLVASISGTRNGMMKAMNNESFGDNHHQINNFFGFIWETDTDYPRGAAKGMEWAMEVRRKLSPYASLAVTYGKSSTLATLGHNQYANIEHHFLSLQTSLSAITCEYVFTMKDSYSGFKVGPVLAIHRVGETSSGEIQDKTITIKPGLHLGFDAALFEKKSWFMAFGIDYAWMTPVTVGPYAEEVTRQEDGIMKTYVSEFDPVKIPLSSLKIGLTMGWKI